MPVSFSDLQLACEFASSGGMGENEAYLNRQSGSQQLVSPALNPVGHVGAGRPSIGRIVLKPTVLRRVV